MQKIRIACLGLSLVCGTAMPLAFAEEPGRSEDPAVLKKLEQIVEGQSQILKKLDEVKDELQIVKIRVSNR